MFDGQEGGVSSIVHTIKSFQGATNVEVAGGLVVVPRWGCHKIWDPDAVAYHI